MNLVGPERKPGMTVVINKDPSGEGVTLTTTETVPTTGWLQKRIAAIRGQEPFLELFRETTETTEYPSIQSLKKAVGREKILRTAQYVVGMTGCGIGLLYVMAGISSITAADTEALRITAAAAIVFGGISIITGYNFVITGFKKDMRLRSISNKAKTIFPN